MMSYNGFDAIKKCNNTLIISRYGFNGMEKDDEHTQGKYDFGARIYDSRLGRWLAIDPMAAKYPGISPYNYAANMPIVLIDNEGNNFRYKIERDPNGGGKVTLSSSIHIYGPDASKEFAEKLNKASSDLKMSGSYIDADGNTWEIKIELNYVYDEKLNKEFNEMNEKHKANQTSDSPDPSIQNPNGGTGPSLLSFSASAKADVKEGDNILLVNTNAEGVGGGSANKGSSSAQVRTTNGTNSVIHETLHMIGFGHKHITDEKHPDVDDIMQEYLMGTGAARTFSQDHINAIGDGFENSSFGFGNQLTKKLGGTVIQTKDEGAVERRPIGGNNKKMKKIQAQRKAQQSIPTK